jgi:hypothetical protein
VAYLSIEIDEHKDILTKDVEDFGKFEKIGEGTSEHLESWERKDLLWLGQQGLSAACFCRPNWPGCLA